MVVDLFDEFHQDIFLSMHCSIQSYSWLIEASDPSWENIFRKVQQKLSTRVHVPHKLSAPKIFLFITTLQHINTGTRPTLHQFYFLVTTGCNSVNLLLFIQGNTKILNCVLQTVFRSHYNRKVSIVNAFACKEAEPCEAISC